MEQEILHQNTFVTLDGLVVTICTDKPMPLFDGKYLSVAIQRKPAPEELFRFQCKKCSWMSEPFIANHSPFDIASCTVCNPPPNNIIFFDPNKSGCPGCTPKSEVKHV